MPRRHLTVSFLAAVTLLTFLGSVTPANGTRTHPGVPDAALADWPAYLLNVNHTSFKPSAAAITPANASTLVPAWTWVPDPPTEPDQPPAQLFSSPTVFRSHVYIGAWTGWFYSIDARTGTVLWKTFLGYQPSKTCPARGLVSTATVSLDPVSGQPTVYVAGQDGYLYALRAADGGVVWRSFVVDPGAERNEGFNWASPTVAGGRIYMGVSSNCDVPLIRGGEKAYDQATGALIAEYWTVAQGSIGGSIWTSAAANRSGRDVFVTTGNANPLGGDAGDSFSVVRLDGPTMVKQDIWTAGVHDDLDFGASPTLFRASVDGVPTLLVAACNKNGTFYVLKAFDLAAGPMWFRRVGGSECLAAAIWDGTRLFAGSDATKVRGTDTLGAVRRLDPATGAVIWATGLTGAVLGSPSLNGAGVLAAGTYDYSPQATNRVFLLDAATGAILHTIDTGGDQVFAQPVFAGPYLFVATEENGLTAFTPSS